LSSKTNSWLPGYIALGITWGSSFLLIKWGLISLSPFGVVFFRSFFGGLTLLAFSVITKQKLPRKMSEIGHVAFVALGMNSVPGYLFAVGETHVSSVTAGIINATTPLMTVLVISLAFREQKINLNQGLGVFIGFFGVLLVTDVFTNKVAGDWYGYLELLLATLCYGIAIPYSRRYVTPLKYSSTALATTQLCASAFALSPFLLLTTTFESHWTAKSFIGMLFLGSVGTGFAYIWNYRNVALAGATIASTVTYVTPVVAAILGVLLLNEHVHLIQYIGGLFILFSAALVQQRIKIVGKKNG
jgi:drug/metabolite transporter (DMT)-like permease